MAYSFYLPFLSAMAVALAAAVDKELLAPRAATHSGRPQFMKLTPAVRAPWQPSSFPQTFFSAVPRLILFRREDAGTCVLQWAITRGLTLTPEPGTLWLPFRATEQSGAKPLRVGLVIDRSSSSPWIDSLRDYLGKIPGIDGS